MIASILKIKQGNTPSQFETIDELLSPIEYDPQINKSDIPSQLPALLAPYAEVRIPENYDPQKPNLYVIAQMHIGGGRLNPQIRGEIHQIQGDMLKIIHLLHAMGTNTQFIEGVENGQELTNAGIRQNPLLWDIPSQELQRYRNMSAIDRASTAAEGIYGAELDSYGIDIPGSAITRRHEDQTLADNNYLLNAKREILLQLCTRFQIPLVPLANENEGSFMDRLAEEIYEKVRLLPAEEQTRLFEEVVKGNQNYCQLLEMYSRILFERYSERDRIFFENLNRQSDRGDALFTVGGDHLVYLTTTSPPSNWNVISIRPYGITPDMLNTPGVQRSIDEWREDIERKGKSHFGFAPINDSASTGQ